MENYGWANRDIWRTMDGQTEIYRELWMGKQRLNQGEKAKWLLVLLNKGANITISHSPACFGYMNKST